MAKEKILDSYATCTGGRVEIMSEPDSRGRVHYAAFWIAEYHPGHPEGEHMTRERGQHFFGVPPDRFDKQNDRLMYLYRITNTGQNSRRYGSCEVCKKPVSEVWYQVEARHDSGGWTHSKCVNLFGHKACLESRRRKPFKTQDHEDFERHGRLRPFKGKPNAKR
jgi:hypothetical protein